MANGPCKYHKGEMVSPVCEGQTFHKTIETAEGASFFVRPVGATPTFGKWLDAVHIQG